MRSLLLAALLVASCKGEEAPATSPIKIDLQRPQHGDGKITFDFLATNTGTQEATVYVFVAAYNMAPKPPTRGIWPAEAGPELNNSSHELIVGQHKRGFPISLAPGATQEAFGQIEAPPGRSKFDTYHVVVYDDRGRKVRDTTGHL